MVNLTLNELRLVAGRRGVKSYKNMSREKLLSTLDESERNFQNPSQNGLERIANMRRIKDYKNMSKEGLLIALLKSERGLAELYKSKPNNAEIEQTQKILMN